MVRFVSPALSDLDLGALRIAVVNWIVSRQLGSGLILRITDEGEPHHPKEHEADVRQILAKFAIPHDHLLYRNESLHRYQQLAVSLMEQGRAFLCTCDADAHTPAASCQGSCQQMSREEITRIREEKIPYVLRIQPPDAPVVFEDTLQGEITTPPEAIGSFVILHADGNPSEDFASAVDEMLGGITTVIDSTKQLEAFARQIHARQMLGYTDPIASAHLPSIRTPDGEPIYLSALLEEGFLPDAILNAILAHGGETPSKVFTLPEAIEWFDLARLDPDPKPFDLERLRRLNRDHLRRMDDKSISGLYGFADGDIGRVIKLYLDEASTLRELDQRIRPIFAPKPCEGELREPMKMLAQLIPTMPMFATFEEVTAWLEERTDLAGDALLEPLRLLLTGAHQSPPLEAIYPLIQSYITEVARCPH